MTTKQPEALRLAEELSTRVTQRWVFRTGDAPASDGYHPDAICRTAATELRRLHTQVEALTAAARQALDAYERFRDADDLDALDNAIVALNNALEGQA